MRDRKAVFGIETSMSLFVRSVSLSMRGAIVSPGIRVASGPMLVK